MNRSVLFALLAAALFGASTPFAKLLVGNMPPVLLAGLLYLGSGLGLTLTLVQSSLYFRQDPGLHIRRYNQEHLVGGSDPAPAPDLDLDSS